MIEFRRLTIKYREARPAVPRKALVPAHQRRGITLGLTIHPHVANRPEKQATMKSRELTFYCSISFSPPLPLPSF